MNKRLKMLFAIVNQIKGFIRKITQAFPITLTDCVDNDSLISMSIEGNTIQNTTTGKNLLPYPYFETTKTENGITFTDNGDGTITANGTATANSTTFQYTDMNTKQLLKAGTYKISGNSSGCAMILYLYATANATVHSKLFRALSDSSTTFTIDRDMYYHWYISVSSGKTLYNATFRPMLMLASETDETYEPYTGGIASPNYNYPQALQSVGERTANILPYPYYETTKTYNGVTFTDNGDGTITANGTAVNSTSTFYFTNVGVGKRPLIKAGTYVYSGNSSICNMYIYLYPDNEGSQSSKVINVKNGNPKSFTIDTDMYYIAYIGVSVGDTVDNVVLNPLLKRMRLDDKYNLVTYPYYNTTTILNGIALTDNGDGTITANGTATANVNYIVHSQMYPIKVKAGNYILKGCPSGGSSMTGYYLASGVSTEVNTNRTITYDVGDGKLMLFDTDMYVDFIIGIRAGVTCENLVFKPMLIDIGSLDYQPYGYKIPVVAETENLFVEGIPTAGFWSSYVNGEGIKGFGQSVSTVAKLKAVIKPNHTYTLSFDMECIAKGSIGTFKNTTYGISVYNSTGTIHVLNGLHVKEMIVGEKKHMTATYTFPSNGDENIYNFYYYTGRYVDENGITSDNDTIRFTNIKIEEADHETEPIVSNVYLKEPMRYGDMLDVKGNAVTRNYGYMEVSGLKETQVYSYTYPSYNYYGFAIYPKVTGQKPGSKQRGFCTHTKATLGTETENIWFGVGNAVIYLINLAWKDLTVEEILAWLDEQKANGTPVEIVYPLEEPITEKIIAPNLPTFKHGTTYSIATTVQPLSGTVEYYSTTKGV